MPFSTWVIKDFLTGTILFEGSYSYCREGIKRERLTVLQVDDDLGIIYTK